MSVVVKRFLCPTAGDPARRSRGSAAAPALEGDGRPRAGAHCAGLSARGASWSPPVDQLAWGLAPGPEESLPPEWANYTAIDAIWYTDKAAARAEVDALKPR